MPSKVVAVRGGLNLSKDRFSVREGELVECYNYEIDKDGVVTSINGYRKFSGGCLFDGTVGFGSSSADTEYQRWGTGPVSTPGGDTFEYAGICVPTMLFSNTSQTIVNGVVGRLPLAGERISGAVDSLNDYAYAVVASNANTMVHAHRIMTWENARSWGALGDYDDTGAGTFGTLTAPEPLYCTSQIGFPPGLFYWKDRLHVVCDIPAFAFTGGGTTELTAGSTVYLYDGGVEDGPFTVERVIVEEGSWAASDAGGVLWLVGLVLNNTIRVQDQGGSTPIEVRSASGGGGVLYCTISSHLEPAAALLSKETGPFAYATSTIAPTTAWERVDLGYEIRFSGGRSPFVVVNRLANDAAVGASATLTSTALTVPGTATSSHWSTPNNAKADDGAVAFATAGTSGMLNPIVLTNFGFAVPTYSIITGIEVTIERQKTGAGTLTINDAVVELVGLTRASENKAKVDAWPGAFATATYGGAADLWGAEVSPEAVNDAAFGVRISVNRSVGGSTPGVAEIDVVKVRIHYKPYESLVYFRDATAGSDVSTGNVVWYYKEKGEWDPTDDAEGIATIYNLSAPTAVKSGLQIWSGAGGTGTRYADTAGVAEKVYLPSSAQCQAEASQYEFEIGNFYGSNKFEQVFGVSGAGPAFSYDGKYAIRIRTGVENNIEKPRHVAKHGYQLALGYNHGDVAFSDVGAPESYAVVTGGSSPVSEDPDFIGGAVVTALADSVYALVSIAEQSLAVFCRGSIQRISGSAGTFTTQVVRAESGVIEYTVKDLGGILMYTDFRGVGLLQPSDIFGQLLPRYVSSNVSSWLTPRLQLSGNSYRTLSGLIRAETVKAKNQYRLFFRDRYVLTMTLVGQDFTPQFSMQQWAHDVRASCSGVNSNGSDLSFFSTSGVLVNNSYGSNYVYQSDVGTTFDGTGIVHRALIMVSNADGPQQFKRYGDMSLHASAFGFMSLGVRAFVNYARSEANSTYQAVTLGSNSSTITAMDLATPTNYVQTVTFGAMGFAMLLQVEKNGGFDYAAGATGTNYQYLMPHSINAVTIHFEPQAPLRGGR